MPYQELIQRNIDLKKAMYFYMRENNRFEWNIRTAGYRLALNVINSEAPRFYISEAKARRVIYYFRLGRVSAKGIRSAWNKHADLYKVYCDLKRINDSLPTDKRKTDTDIIRDAIESPAPRWYCPRQLAARLMNEVMNEYFVV